MLKHSRFRLQKIELDQLLECWGRLYVSEYVSVMAPARPFWRASRTSGACGACRASRGYMITPQAIRPPALPAGSVL
jgi:hypothetical protein